MTTRTYSWNKYITRKIKSLESICTVDGAAARKKVLGNLSLLKMVENTVNYYKRILGESYS